MILLGMLFYRLYTRKSGNLNELLVAVVFLGGYLFHMIWESSSSYTLPYFVMLIPYAVKGFAEYGKWADNAWQWFTGKTAGEKKGDVKRWFTGKHIPASAALAVAVVLILLFTQTSLFGRTIALDDGADAVSQFYQLEDEEG
jgi:membrane-associated protease RseP (regulator of RpoE activity)